MLTFPILRFPDFAYTICVGLSYPDVMCLNTEMQDEQSVKIEGGGRKRVFILKSRQTIKKDYQRGLGEKALYPRLFIGETGIPDILSINIGDYSSNISSRALRKENAMKYIFLDVYCGYKTKQICRLFFNDMYPELLLHIYLKSSS